MEQMLLGSWLKAEPTYVRDQIASTCLVYTSWRESELSDGGEGKVGRQPHSIFGMLLGWALHGALAE